MGVEFKDFDHMPPERRVEELQKLVSNLRAQIKDREEDIITAEDMLSKAQEEARVLESVSIPETKKDVEAIEETMGELPAEGAELEEMLQTAPRVKAPEAREEFIHRIAHVPVADLYGELKNIAERERRTGIESEQDLERVYAIKRGLEQKKTEGYVPSEKDQHLLTAAEGMAESMYRSAGESWYKK